MSGGGSLAPPPPPPMQGPLRRSNRVIKPTLKVLENANLADEPKTTSEALARPDASKWQQAMDTEFDSLIKNKTWELVDLPAGRKAIGTKWVFKTKRDGEGKIERYKARLVAKGFAQKL